MLEALQGIVNFFVSIVEFVIMVFKDLAFVIKALGMAIINIPNYLGFLPAAIVALFGGCMGIIVIYKVLGRD